MIEVLKKLHPSEVSGPLRTARTRVGLFLGILFLILPWLKIGGHPILLFDLHDRKFSILGQLFRAQDVPLTLFFVGAFLLAVATVTAVFGRAWCGWACPQTVFIDLVFRKIEKWVEGDAVTRRRREGSPFSIDRFFLMVLKWSLFFLVGLVISHSLIAYFVETNRLFQMIQRSPSENWETFGLMLTIVAFTVFNFGWLREKFCTHICPYGRFQTVLLDEKSMVVTYDSARSDCIDCKKCVNVCPTGIDIREGMQLECIACTACIDACSPVMRKIGKPQGLIRYGTLSNPTEKISFVQSVLRPRPMIYIFCLIVISAAFFFVLGRRNPVDIAIVRATGAPYEKIVGAGGADEVLNHYFFDLQNSTFNPVKIELKKGINEENVALIGTESAFGLQAGQSQRISLFFRFSKLFLKDGAAKLPIQFFVRDEITGARTIQNEEVTLVGPY